MNGTPKLNRLTTIKRHNIFIVALSVIIAASFWIAPLLKLNDALFSYKIFRSAGGWGYDILVNDTLQIHQDYIPVLTEKKSFSQQKQAKQAAMLVIEKLKAGKNPAISRVELDKIVASNE
jgi:hypothetical protein